MSDVFGGSKHLLVGFKAAAADLFSPGLVRQKSNVLEPLKPPAHEKVEFLFLAERRKNKIQVSESDLCDVVFIRRD